jgi:hypothetical protein
MPDSWVRHWEGFARFSAGRPKNPDPGKVADVQKHVPPMQSYARAEARPSGN